MSGILGVWNLGGQPIDRMLLARMNKRLEHRGPDGQQVWLQGEVGLASQLLKVTPESAIEQQPYVSRAGHVVVWDGRLDNRQELYQALKDHVALAFDAPDLVFIAAAYELWGESFAEKLKGEFAFAIFDNGKETGQQKLLLVRDAMGARPLYYCQTKDAFIFASEIKAILIHPQVSSRPNDDLVSQFISSYYWQESQDLTFFAGVFSLVPAHLVVITPRSFSRRRYWDFNPAYQTRLKSFNEYVEGFRQYFNQAVSRCLRSASPVAISVSGGLDSSSIFCQAEALRRQSPGTFPKLAGISFVAPVGAPAGETEFLEEVERVCGIQVDKIPHRPPTWVKHSSETLFQVEGPFLQGDTVNDLYEMAKARGARVLLSGAWGDHFVMSQAYLVDLLRGLSWKQALAHLAEYGNWVQDADPAYFTETFRRDLRSYLLPEFVTGWLRKLRALMSFDAGSGFYSKSIWRRAQQGKPMSNMFCRSFPTMHAKDIYKHARSSHHLIYGDVFKKFAARYQVELCYPFLDRDLVAFLMSIPGEMQTHNGVLRAIQREALRGVMPDAIVERRGKAGGTELVNEGMKRDFPQLIQQLERNSSVARWGYVDRKGLVEKLSQMHSAIDDSVAVPTWKLCDLFALELWLRTFFDVNNFNS